jgi:hypothetical protein
MSTRSQNEKKFGRWEELPGGGRRYRLDVDGRLGWRARYLKEVDAQETTLRFWPEFMTPKANWRRRMKSSRWIKAIRKCRLPL